MVVARRGRGRTQDGADHPSESAHRADDDSASNERCGWHTPVATIGSVDGVTADSARRSSALDPTTTVANGAADEHVAASVDTSPVASAAGGDEDAVTQKGEDEAHTYI